MRKTASNVTAYLGIALRAGDRAESYFYCWRIKEALGIVYTDEQRKKMFEAESYMAEAEKRVKEVYAEIIGNLAVQEARKWPK